MKEYLKLLIVLVTLVSVAIVILPEGRMKKTTSICFSFLICLNLLMPIKSFAFDYLFEVEEHQYDLSMENDYRKGLYSYAIKNYLKEEGIVVEEVYIEFEEGQKIKNIILKLDKSVLKDEEQHINIIVKAKECLSKKLNISFSEISIYE